MRGQSILDWIKKKKIIIDFGYSFIAYALPVAMIQLAVQPIIAKITEVSVNALFIVMYGVVKLCVSVIIEPLASLRLIEKEKGKKIADTMAITTLFSCYFVLLWGWTRKSFTEVSKSFWKMKRHTARWRAPAIHMETVTPVRE